MFRCVGIAWAFIASLAVAPGAHAATRVVPPLSLTPYAIEPFPHVVATVGLYGVLALAEGTVKPALAGSLSCRTAPAGGYCDTARLWGPDRSVVGNHAAGWRRVSDLGNALVFGGAVAAAVADSYLSLSATPGWDGAIDVLVMAESVGVATLVTHGLKFAIRRPRPGMYAPGGFGVEGQLSFPSGHTTAAAAGCAAYATTYALRHPHGPGRYGVMAAGVLLTGLTAYGRVGGGMHFYTDVVAGALVGATVGYLLPTFYRRHLGVVVDSVADAVGGQALRAGVVLPL